MSDSILNISFYKFFEMNDRPTHRASLLRQCKELELKGTILLTPEGINGFIAGPIPQVEKFKALVHAEFPGQSFFFKDSYSDRVPFRRMLVKLKNETITLADPTICPEKYSSPRLDPRELKAWLDAGKEVILVDTRNDYEARLGTFKNARVLPIDSFRNFPAIADRELADLKLRKDAPPVVAFCTGGIRCEKAAPVLERLGIPNVYQLEGGVLEYFRLAEGAHWDGECFVFDYRGAVTRDLKPGTARICFACLEPVTAEEQKSPTYVAGVSCPRCVHRLAASSTSATQRRTIESS